MKLTCYGAYTNGEEFWLPSKEINALYYMNLANGNTQYIGAFPNYLNDMAWKIRKVIEYQNELYFFSIGAYQVWKLNKITGKIDEYTYSTQQAGLITNVEVIQKEAWVIPNSFSSPIICFDLQEKRGYPLQWDNETYLDWGTGSFTRTARMGDHLYFATRNKNDIHLCILDCGHKKISFRDLDTLCRINCIGIKDNRLAIFGENRRKQGVLQIYDIHTMQMIEERELSLAEKLMGKSEMKYFSLIFSADNIMLVPAWAGKVIVYNFNTKAEEYIDYPNGFCSILGMQKAVLFYETMEHERKVYFMPYLIPQILALDTEKLCFDTWNTEVEKGEFRKAYQNIFSSEWIRLDESKNLTLDTFCTMIEDTDSHSHNRIRDNMGSSIYRSLQSIYGR